MTKINRLKQTARQAASQRGHSLCRFAKLTTGSGNQIHIAHCGVCQADVSVKLHPLPNEIDIGGEAVALNCTGV